MKFPEDKLIKAFLREFGQTDQTLMEALDKEGMDSDSFAEYAVNMGYRWIAEPYEEWVHRDAPNTEIEQIIFDYLETNFQAV